MLQLQVMSLKAYGVIERSFGCNLSEFPKRLLAVFCAKGFKDPG